VVGSSVEPEVAIIYDWDNRWGIEGMQGLGHEFKNYPETVIAHYVPLWKRGIPVDVIAEEADFSGYKLIIAPMLYMLKPGVAIRLIEFVSQGGTLVGTYWTGIVDENDLAFLGGWPGEGLRKIFGIWDEEIDTLTSDERNSIIMADGNELGISGAFEARHYITSVHAENAKILATYSSDFYAGQPALTVNDFGSGQAYYVASRNSDDFLDAFLSSIAEKMDISQALPISIPEGVTAQLRINGEVRFIFVMNFNPFPMTINLANHKFSNLLTGETVTNSLELETFGFKILTEPAK
jgi:beta-galactosidase